MEYNLLEKTELWITGLRLAEVNLTELARAAAETLALPPADVKVVDVHEGLVTLDILRRTVLAEDIAGKQAALLERLEQVPGVSLGPQAAIHSDGVLGMIAMDPAETPAMLERSQTMTDSIIQAVARRAIIYSTGFELQQGLIEDTNGPYIREMLAQHNFKVTVGPVLADEQEAVAFAFNDAVNRGYGLAITTGGVGAESKDRSVEGLLQIEPEAATAWLVKYEQGQGRHEKEGVRIAVGQLGLTTMITLPGPHDEVETAMPIICRHLTGGTVDKHRLAAEIATALRATLHEKMAHHKERKHPPNGDNYSGKIGR